ncbi:hypothetical protein PR202_gb02778 [Eleusine coracana subsp. coracana]|uniref:WRKY domain-containing protein n=1 Tax=Eleusine coracana subsp. coracana TaxID=191504 RepID=A0AAV5E150_ELECO|nr:hypothetical protein PR202_gb02778 [Eleusine coracana subsp. coracana]
MAGTNNRGALMEDWMLPSPSPRTLMSNFWNEEFSSSPFSNIFSDNSSSKPLDGIDKSKTSFDSSGEGTVQETKASLLFESNLFDSNEKSTSHGGLAERMSARAGFGVLKIDTSRINSSAPVRSPVTIPPGVSPRELLESPVFLPSAIAQPSPTTGKLPFLMPHNCKSTTSPVPKKAEDCLHDNSAFSFQPLLRSKPPNFSTAEKGASVVHQNQSSENDNQQESSLPSNSTGTEDVTDANLIKPKTCDSMFDNDNPSPTDEQEESKENQNLEYSSALVISPAEDGYNWRKYGQKQVKNSEHPRSYYKCTHPDCPVKKKVERSQDGQITEIVYKGSHSHPLPPPNRRPSVPLSHFNDFQIDGQEDICFKHSHNATSSQGSTPNGHIHDVHSGVLETKLSGSLITTDIADKSVMESGEAVDVSSTISSSDKNDRGTHGFIPSTFDGDETESKRRKMDVLPQRTLPPVPLTWQLWHQGLSGSLGLLCKPQASNLHQRSQLAQASIAQFGNVAAYGSVCLPPQLSAASGGFCFGMLPSGMAVQVPSHGTAMPVHIPGHPPAMQRYQGLMLPRGEMKVNSQGLSSLPVATRTASAIYQQLMGRLPQGPQT